VILQELDPKCGGIETIKGVIKITNKLLQHIRISSQPNIHQHTDLLTKRKTLSIRKNLFGAATPRV
jgi:hypothetical protein